MVSVYKKYGIYDEDNCICVEEGECISSISFLNNSETTELKDVTITNINDDYIIVEDSEFEETKILIEDIIDFDL